MRLPCLVFFSLTVFCGITLRAEDEWVVYEGGEGAGKGKHIVLISGDEEYRSEECLPQLAKILATHHGFKCTVLFAIGKDGSIDPNVSNIPGTKALDTADLMIIFTRFRNLPDEQMKPIADYVAAGKPIIGLRTATHAFNIPGGKTYSKWSHNSKEKDWEGGFGRQILGETWIAHHGGHGKQSTRGIPAQGQEKNPILKGIAEKSIWGTTDVYTVRLPLPAGCTPVVMGAVLEGMHPDDKVFVDAPDAKKKLNEPMMPVAWTKTYESESGKVGRVFTTTMGSAEDLTAEGTRRMLVNAAYWCMKIEEKIPAQSKVDIVGDYQPSPFKGGGARKGVMPSEHAMAKP